jgi:CheY-like chemotaxis protein
VTKDFEEPTTVERIIGRNIREKRMKRGLTLTDVSTMLRCSYQQVQKYESAKTRINAATLYKLANLYDVEVDKFFEGVAEVDDDFGELNSIRKAREEDNKLNVMIVEDNPGDESVIRSALEEFKNMNIICAHDGVQTLDILKYKTLCRNFTRADLILLDIFLPKRDGLVVLKELKRDRNLQDVPVIMVSNSTNPEVMSAAYKNGAAGYICKSFDVEVFKKSMVNCLKYWTESVVLPSTIRRYFETSNSSGRESHPEQLCLQ